MMMNEDWNRFSKWWFKEKNSWPLNIEKFSIRSFTKKGKRESIDLNYKINNARIKKTEFVKDRGVIFDKNLTFKKHFNFIVTHSNY